MPEGTIVVAAAAGAGAVSVGPANGGMLKSVTLTPAAATAAVTIADSDGTRLVLQAAASGGSVQVRFSGMTYKGQLTATCTGTGANAYTEV